MKSLIEKNVLKPYYYGLIILASLIVGLQLFNRWYTINHPPQFPQLTFSQESTTASDNKLFLSDFDPNQLSEEQWKNLGFSDKQVATILKYKKSLGGNFKTKEELARCYAISDEKFNQISSFILLDNNKTIQDQKRNKFSKQSLKIAKAFNPNNYTSQDWQNIGFSEKQAASILKYKNYLGGKFSSKSEIKACFIINEDQYNQLERFLILPHISYSKANNIQLKNFDPNTLDAKGWQDLGFSKKQAAVILNYKNKILKGSFKNLEDIKKCHVINTEKYNTLLPYIKLNPNHNITTVAVVKQETDFSKIDLNQITFKQLIEFGFDERAAGSYIGFRKKLGGFATKEQILTTYNIDTDLTNKLIKTCPLDSSKIEKYRLSDAPEEWLKNHPYFKYSADKIIYYRITYPDDKKIWRFLKLKPEYETRMKLYTINE